KYCVMFISSEYAEKAWPTHERRSAVAKAITQREEYILPARFDDTEVPGIRPTIKYVSLRERSPEALGALVLASGAK
ncbi:MAG TPA: TIR domain-containing protein, partial [Ktedonobacterales bacterium]|nr:TIR domain-containing protein [Ktedonobacterales bacterium]